MAGTVVYRDKGSLMSQDISDPKSFLAKQCDRCGRTGSKQMDLVIKDNSGGQGHAHRRPDPEKFFRPRCESLSSRSRPARPMYP